MDDVDIDGMLHLVGDFGRYQFLLLFLFSIINVLSGFHYFGQTFISVIPEYECNSTSFDEGANGLVEIGACSIKIYSEDHIQETPCTFGWNFTSQYNYISIIQEFNWICGLEWIPALGQSVFFMGSVVGSLIFGVLADKIGRLHCLVASHSLLCIGNMFTVFSKDPISFIMSRFIAGGATDTNFVMMYIIVMEYIRPKMRTLGLNLTIGVFYCLSCMTVPWVAVSLGNWWLFLTVISLPNLLIISFYLYVPESAQWLISKGRTEEAIKCFKEIAKYNRREIPQKSIDSLKQYCEKHVDSGRGKHENLLGLLKTPKLRRKTLILVFKSMVMTLCYDAISRNVNGLGYSPFLVFSITSATILPSCIFILITQDRIGRKALASGALFVSGVFTISSGVFQASMEKPQPMIILALAIIARLSVNVAYNSGAQYAVELIPVVVRGQGVSAIHVAGYAASFFSSQILFLSTIWRPSPDVILGTLLILGAIACLFLPETLNKVLPVTLEDGELFGEGEGIFEFSCFKKPRSISTTELVE
ncbi:organic cation transporter protein-like [Coccinella septempunctata]|uniref:organic cation transporter protein-like n=1 Tax=Coccinella septempunctata TaxID=41139 RepID=UPI001D063516|nr:organic cation transporter protein-like [Coccinella septempunctata]XP_044765759.1 organic cation transporter protein-like [Coccinella septempunctata]